MMSVTSRLTHAQIFSDIQISLLPSVSTIILSTAQSAPKESIHTLKAEFPKLRSLGKKYAVCPTYHFIG